MEKRNKGLKARYGILHGPFLRNTERGKKRSVFRVDKWPIEEKEEVSVEYPYAFCRYSFGLSLLKGEGLRIIYRRKW